MAQSQDGSPTKAKKAPSPHEVRMAPLDTNPVFQCLAEELRMELRTYMELETFIIE